MNKKTLIFIVIVLGFSIILYTIWIKVKKSTEYLRGDLNNVVGTNAFITQSWCEFVLEATPTDTEEDGYNQFYDTCLLAKEANWTEQEYLDAWSDGNPSEFNNL